ncbi:MAG TPA: ATP-binding protein [Streptosporangiaceae bacterium]
MCDCTCMCTPINGIVRTSGAGWTRPRPGLSSDSCTRDDVVTSAQAPDLTCGGRDLRNDNLRRSASCQCREMPLLEVAEPFDLLSMASSGHHVLIVSPGPESVKAARDFTAATLRGWRLNSLVEEAVIVASELVTNGIRHGTGAAAPEPDTASVELACQRNVTRVVCVVTDGSSKPPVLGEGDMCAESGRGLQVVQALAAAWGWFTLGACEKAVWAAFLLPSVLRPWTPE